MAPDNPLQKQNGVVSMELNPIDLNVMSIPLDEQTEQHSHSSNSSETKNREASTDHYSNSSRLRHLMQGDLTAADLIVRETSMNQSTARSKFNADNIYNVIEITEEESESVQEQLQINGKTDSKEENSKTFIGQKNVPCDNQENESNANSSPVSNLAIVNVEEASQAISTEVETNQSLPRKLYQRIENHVDILLNPEEIPVYEFYDEDEEKKKIEQGKKDRKLKEIKERTCIHCNETFPDAMDVLRHKRVAHPTKRIILKREEIKPYMALEDRKQCPICFVKICPKGYKSKYVKHMLTHCGDYKFPCRVCGMKFRRQDHQKGHESRHIVPHEKVE